MPHPSSRTTVPAAENAALSRPALPAPDREARGSAAPWRRAACGAGLAVLLSALQAVVPGFAGTAEARARLAGRHAAAPRHAGLVPAHGTRPKAHRARVAQAGPTRAKVAQAGGGTQPAVTAALENAVRTTGADPVLLQAMAWGESRFDPNARNRRSSARGLMQFTRATWLEMVRDAGPRHGLAREAQALRTNPRTGAICADKRTLDALLARRSDPRLSAALAAERVLRQRAALEQALGRPVAPADLYLVHLLGPAGAKRFLSAHAQAPSRPAAAAVSRDGVRANPGLFGAPRRGGVSLTQFRDGVEQRLAAWRPAPALPAADGGTSSASPGAGQVMTGLP